MWEVGVHASSILSLVFSPYRGGIQGAIERAAPTLAAAHAISRAVNIPVMAASGLSDVTAPMALAAGARGVGVGSAGNTTLVCRCWVD